ncbi:MAG TPA: DNA-formamidopyrimidine glycosylase family protein, partial [Lacipirellulaceae bacterium]|nr:DNA-formamidopyrimidine glycosylase family protein [Lacipirellulaceae bacterium]
YNGRMPELPEVETMRRGLEPAVGCRITGVERAACARKPITIEPDVTALARRTVGTRIERTDRVGKRVVLWLDSGDALVFEPRMTGLVLLADPPDPLYTRLRIALSPRRAGRGRNAAPQSSRQPAAPRQILYWDRRGLGNVRLVTARQFQVRYGLDVLGPDALTVTAELYKERLGRSSRPVTVGLLDQRAVAGIGNLYASEILHVAGVAPGRPCCRLTREQWERIAAATLQVLELAIRFEGSTLSDGTYRNALNKAGGYQNQHRVYDKAGAKCPRPGCHGEVARIVQAQRSTFFCPSCQGRR